MTLSKNTQKVLDFVNKLRRENSLPELADLQPGERGNPWHCPIANSLGGETSEGQSVEADVTGLSVDVRINNARVSSAVTPGFVRDWVRRFDGGGFKRYRA